ncbi:DUF6461 domain-containing protein [Actinophytocola sp. NPDC049390]|uniref:DUF6461 domain-containing protein n=1 Tax=Actinophytocola sp. NPDC049390 TaxID=3363894 RepID=UPI0037B0D5A4
MGIKDFEVSVAAVLPDIVALVPKEPAARLGRWERKESTRERGTPVRRALDDLGGLLTERLLGALELTVDRLVVDIPPDLVSGLTPFTGTTFGMAWMGEKSATELPVALVEKVHPGAADLVVSLVDTLRDMASRPDATGDEEAIAAQHGAAHLALAVAVSTAVLRSLGTEVAAETPAIIGVALGAAAIVLPTVPKPHAYAAAVLEQTRAGYLMPRSSTESALVTDHRFWFTEGAEPETVDFSANGLVTAVQDGVVIRTGTAEGRVSVSTEIRTGPPDELDLTHWDDVVEISWTAPRGGALMHGAGSKGGRQPRWLAPPWPGDYRVRVHVSGRDGDDVLQHRLVIWQAPAAPEVVHKKTDRLGHRLRGEPEPPLVIPPYADHRWIEKGPLCVAATITVVHGLTPDEVVSAFGADPAAPVSIEQTAGQPSRRLGGYPEQLVAVLAVDDVVLAVEDNGFQGADQGTLKALSRNGKAASLYWNVNANFQFAIAERGELVYAGDPRDTPGAPHMEDLDIDDFRHRNAKGLTALARATGRAVTAADIAAIHAADRAYVLEPRSSSRGATSARATSTRVRSFPARGGGPTPRP